MQGEIKIIDTRSVEEVATGIPEGTERLACESIGIEPVMVLDRKSVV